MFIYSFPRPVTLLVEFEGVDDVLPDAVGPPATEVTGVM